MSNNSSSLRQLILAEEGKLSLGSPVSQFLPELKNLEVGVDMADGSLTRKLPQREITVHHDFAPAHLGTHLWVARPVGGQAPLCRQRRRQSRTFPRQIHRQAGNAAIAVRARRGVGL